MIVASQPKDPDAVEPFEMDWTAWLDGEAVTDHTVTADEASGVTVDSSAEASGVITAWLSGGTARSTARITFRVTTDGGRTNDQTLLLRISER